MGHLAGKRCGRAGCACGGLSLACVLLLMLVLTIMPVLPELVGHCQAVALERPLLRLLYSIYRVAIPPLPPCRSRSPPPQATGVPGGYASYHRQSTIQFLEPATPQNGPR